MNLFSSNPPRTEGSWLLLEKGQDKPKLVGVFKFGEHEYRYYEDFAWILVEVPIEDGGQWRQYDPILDFDLDCTR